MVSPLCIALVFCFGGVVGGEVTDLDGIAHGRHSCVELRLVFKCSGDESG